MTADGCGRAAVACHHAARRWPDNLDVDERPVSADVMGLVASRHQGIDSACIDACVGNFVPNAVIVVHDETLASRDAIAPVSKCVEPAALVGGADTVLARGFIETPRIGHEGFDV